MILSARKNSRINQAPTSLQFTTSWSGVSHQVRPAAKGDDFHGLGVASGSAQPTKNKPVHMGGTVLDSLLRFFIGCLIGLVLFFVIWFVIGVAVCFSELVSDKAK